MKTIQLTQGKTCVCDDEDFPELSKYRWRFGSPGYAVRTAKVNGRWTVMSMHRQLLNVPLNFQTDHINGDKLDNRKENLRVCTPSQNRCNRGKTLNNTSGIKGVFWHKRDNKWRAQIKVGGIQFWLGYFDSMEDASKAYNEAAIRLHGEFARLN